MGEKEIKKVGFCPHCGNRAPQKLVYTQYFTPRWYSVESGEEAEDDGSSPPGAQFVAVCETCNEILVYTDILGEHSEEYFISADLTWPTSGLHKSVPKIIADCYSEAERIQKIAPNAFAVQIRRALEAVCDNRGAKGGTLQHRLKELVTRGEIPKTLAEISDVLRILGNVGAHAAEQGIKPIQVQAINDFFRAILEYVYIAPSKLEEFTARLKKLQKKSKKTIKNK